MKIMRKKLFFDDTFRINRSMYILIDNGKIREYDGANFIPFILNGTPQPEFKIFEINSDFELVKLSKYDQKKLNINANYKVDCHYLLSKLLKDSHIKLNPIEKFRIDYSKKESVFHKMNFNQKLIAFICFSLLPLLIGFTWNYFAKIDSKTEQTQSPKPDSTTINQDRKVPTIKADTVSDNTIKLDLDSLVSD